MLVHATLLIVAKTLPRPVMEREIAMAKTKNDKSTSDKSVAVTKSAPEPGHLQITVSGPAEHVMAALSKMNFQQQLVAAAGPEPTVDDALHQWLSGNPVGQQIPDQLALQQVWSKYGSGGAYIPNAQQRLATQLNETLFGNANYVDPSDLTADLTVGALKQNLHRP
jgi:hypothetical protein